MAARPKCRHCKRRNISRPRKLCHACYYDPAIKALYPPITSYALSGGEDDFYHAAEEPEPSDTLPGTPEREAVYAERVHLRQEVKSIKDRRYPRE